VTGPERHRGVRRAAGKLRRVDLASKLQVRPGQRIAIINAPESLLPELPQVTTDDAIGADAVLAFVTTQDEISTVAVPALLAAQADRLAWIAYPKAGQLGTDLNRDRLVQALDTSGVQPVRQISVDSTWSALRFRRAG
jgi:hypothetical protein